MKAVENVAMRRRLRWGLLLGWVNAPKAFANSKAILRRQIPPHQQRLFSTLDFLDIVLSLDLRNSLYMRNKEHDNDQFGSKTSL